MTDKIVSLKDYREDQVRCFQCSCMDVGSKYVTSFFIRDDGLYECANCEKLHTFEDIQPD